MVIVSNYYPERQKESLIGVKVIKDNVLLLNSEIIGFGQERSFHSRQLEKGTYIFIF